MENLVGGWDPAQDPLGEPSSGDGLGATCSRGRCPCPWQGFGTG